jgi:hypothetical protein
MGEERARLFRFRVMAIALTSSGAWSGGKFSVECVWNVRCGSFKMIRLSARPRMQVENLCKYSLRYDIVTIPLPIRLLIETQALSQSQNHLLPAHDSLPACSFHALHRALPKPVAQLPCSSSETSLCSLACITQLGGTTRAHIALVPVYYLAPRSG